jgi:hypothetical protein
MSSPVAKQRLIRKRPPQLKLDFLIRGISLVLDVDLRGWWYRHALPGNLNTESLALLNRIGKAPELGDELARRIVFFDVAFPPLLSRCHATRLLCLRDFAAQRMELGCWSPAAIARLHANGTHVATPVPPEAVLRAGHASPRSGRRGNWCDWFGDRLPRARG